MKINEEPFEGVDFKFLLDLRNRGNNIPNPGGPIVKRVKPHDNLQFLKTQITAFTAK